MDYRAGMRLKSVVCTTEVIVVKPPPSGSTLMCGGAPMIAVTDTATGEATISDDARGGSQLGKRYVAPDTSLELLCTKNGVGSLALDAAALEIQGAKPLPPSD
jgi:hypothetical protein